MNDPLLNQAALVNSSVTRTTSFLNIEFDNSSLSQVVDTIGKLSKSEIHHYVVTPNVDHVVMLDSFPGIDVRERFRFAYNAATIRLCDSRILAALARLKGIKLPVIPGSDLTALLMSRHFDVGTRVAIIGGTFGTLEKVQSLFPLPEFVQHIPPMGLLDKPQAIAAIPDFLAKAKAHYVLMAIGAPRSEIVAELCARDGRFGGVSLCIGASIEFITGEKKRAPLWVQQLSMEWAHRLLTEPSRLWRRYLLEGPRVLRIFLRGGIS